MRCNREVVSCNQAKVILETMSLLKVSASDPKIMMEIQGLAALDTPLNSGYA